METTRIKKAKLHIIPWTVPNKYYCLVFIELGVINKLRKRNKITAIDSRIAIALANSLQKSNKLL